MLNHLSRLICLALLFCLSNVVFASDGVLEINQTCAVETGCFAGDSPGFPVTITTNGSYQLTGNLTVPDENTTAISPNSNLTINIDLNGFVISGVTSCSGFPNMDNFQCSPLGSGSGIASGSTIRVTNGAIRGMGDFGIRAGELSQIENVVFTRNGGLAIQINGAGGGVHNVKVIRNGGGIEAGLGNVINSFVSLVGTTAIDAGTLIAGNRIANVDGDGIDTGPGVVRDNVVELATGFGLTGSNNAGYLNNYFGVNNGGNANPQVATSPGPFEMGINRCGNNTTCP